MFDQLPLNSNEFAHSFGQAFHRGSIRLDAKSRFCQDRNQHQKDSQEMERYGRWGRRMLEIFFETMAGASRPT